MNTPLRRVGLAMMVLVVLLLANDTYVQVVKASSYQDNPANQRTIDNAYEQQRGQILAANGQVLASSVTTNDQLKYLRTYANGPMYAPVTGYFSVNYGLHGMESVENTVLDGTDDRLFVRRLSDLITGRNPAGGDVELTIDPKVQAAAYNTMVQDNFTGAAVAIQPSTGKILAMVSTPSFDPNPLASHTTSTEKQAWNSYDPASSTSVLINQAVQAAYPPGSTFKLIDSAAALNAGIIDENTPSLPNSPVITLPGTNTTMQNDDGETCPGGVNGQVSLKDALAHSCNTAFATLAGRVGAAGIAAQAAKFGFGSTSLAVPLSVTESCVGPKSGGNCMNIQNGQAGVYQSGIGQLDVLETPMQDAMIAATIANGGTEMQPQLVNAILAPDLSTIQGYSPQTLNSNVMSSQVASTITDMMVASEQTGLPADSIQIASKTGTAEHGTGSHATTQPYGWYVAFAPANNPQIAVAVVVTAGGSFDTATMGAKVGGPVGHAMINAELGGS